MKTFKKHIAFLTGTFLLFCSSQLYSQNVTVSTYYPSLVGSYKELRFHPRADLPATCTIGSLYVNSSNYLQYCEDIAGVPTWSSLNDLWTQNGDLIYLTDSVSNSNLNVGLGIQTPEFKLSIINDGGITATGAFGSGTILPNLTLNDLNTSRFIWYPRKAAFRAGYATTSVAASVNNWLDANIGVYSVGMGKDPRASASYSVVAGGDSNIASGQHSNVVGGQSNTVSANYSSIIGGNQNSVSGQHSTIIGGDSNTTNSDFTTIYGGQSNEINNTYSVIGGGLNNSILVYIPSYSNINGGSNNIIADQASSNPIFSAIGGGENNTIHNSYSVIMGGRNNTIDADYATIGGGENNNIFTQSFATISGGQNNTASGYASVVTGGYNNVASGSHSTVSGGSTNTASGNYSAVSGGERNTASGLNSVILGGSDNIAAGDYSWAGGKNMQLSAAADRTFAWGYSDTPVTITASDAFIIAPGTLIGSGAWNPKVGVRDTNPDAILEINWVTPPAAAAWGLNIFRTGTFDIFAIKSDFWGISRATPTTAGYLMQVGLANNAYLDAGGYWTNTSSREYKENIKPLSSEDAEKGLDELKPVTFNYKVRPNHLETGFIAEDVPEIVAMNDRESLNSMDIIAVLTKTAQDQEKQIKEQKQRIERIKAQINTLEMMDKK